MLIYVGTYTEPIRFGTGAVLRGKGKGIHILRMGEKTGALEMVGVMDGVVNPSYLTLDHSGKFLYAVNELKSYQDSPTGTVSAFAVDERTGGLRLLNIQPTGGTDPCHVTVDAERKHLFVANFMSGSVCVLRVREDGSLGEVSDFIQHQGASIDPVRQTGPHAHSVTLDRTNRIAFVPDLGLDKLFIYHFDPRRGVLQPNEVPWIEMKPGSGPRHVAPHPKGKFLYLINELNSTVAVLALDSTTWTPRVLQVLSTLPDGYHGDSTCADVQLSPSGEFLYASNRGHDSIAIFAVDQDSGLLREIAHVMTEGRTPRGFRIDPSGEFLLVANQDSDSIVTFRIDAVTGMLSPTGHVVQVPTPVCVTFRVPVANSNGGRAWPR